MDFNQLNNKSANLRTNSNEMKDLKITSFDARNLNSTINNRNSNNLNETTRPIALLRIFLELF